VVVAAVEGDGSGGCGYGCDHGHGHGGGEWLWQWSVGVSALMRSNMMVEGGEVVEVAEVGVNCSNDALALRDGERNEVTTTADRRVAVR
jgi:hypothetical protein